MRLTECDRAKGLAIFLVVMGHLSRTAPPGNSWYDVLKFDIVYMFHMGFFFCISGFLASYTLPSIRSVRDYTHYARRRFLRFFPGFLVYGLAMLCAKSLLGAWTTVENPPPSFLRGLMDILLCPMRSCAGELWFIYVLLLFSLCLPVAWRATKGKMAVLLPFLAVLHFAPGSDLFALNLAGSYAFFFVLGACAARQYEVFGALVDRWGKWLLPACALSFTIPLTGLDHAVMRFSYPFATLLIGSLSVPTLWYVVRSRVLPVRGLFECLGMFSYSIYMMHFMALGLLRMGLHSLGSLEGWQFPVVAPLLLAGGLSVPVYVKRRVLPHVPVLDAII